MFISSLMRQTTLWGNGNYNLTVIDWRCRCCCCTPHPQICLGSPPGASSLLETGRRRRRADVGEGDPGHPQGPAPPRARADSAASLATTSPLPAALHSSVESAVPPMPPYPATGHTYYSPKVFLDSISFIYLYYTYKNKLYDIPAMPGKLGHMSCRMRRSTQR